MSCISSVPHLPLSNYRRFRILQNGWKMATYCIQYLEKLVLVINGQQGQRLDTSLNTVLAIWHTGHRPGGPLTQCGPVRSAMFFFFFFFSLNSLQLGRPIGYRGLAVCCQHRHILLVYCLSLSINHGLTGSESPDSAVNHNTNQGGAGPHGMGGSLGTGCC